MKGKTGEIKSQVKEIAETAVRIDRLLTEAKDMAIRLKETSDSLSSMVTERDNNASGK
jgi:predicted ATP-grasp superfamily ATP-dependent carboligase